MKTVYINTLHILFFDAGCLRTLRTWENYNGRHLNRPYLWHDARDEAIVVICGSAECGRNSFRWNVFALPSVVTFTNWKANKNHLGRRTSTKTWSLVISAVGSNSCFPPSFCSPRNQKYIQRPLATFVPSRAVAGHGVKGPSNHPTLVHSQSQR